MLIFLRRVNSEKAVFCLFAWQRKYRTTEKVVISLHFELMCNAQRLNSLA